jgi:hypothetical protein
LVRSRQLDAGGGRGPGGGVRATPESVALLLLSILATEHLSETEAQLSALAPAKPVGRKRCPFTNTTSFLRALGNILGSTGKPDLVTKVVVSRTADLAEIHYLDRDEGHKERVSKFAGTNSREPGISTAAILDQALLTAIAADVQAVVIDEIETQE